jgi:hypothetical protein
MFNKFKRSAAVWAKKNNFFLRFRINKESVLADFTKKLPLTAVIIVNI